MALSFNPKPLHSFGPRFCGQITLTKTSGSPVYGADVAGSLEYLAAGHPVLTTPEIRTQMVNTGDSFTATVPEGLEGNITDHMDYLNGLYGLSLPAPPTQTPTRWKFPWF